jgi:hypothetical protein
VSFASGWALAAGLTIVAALWWTPPAESRSLAKRIRLHLVLALSLAAVFAVHVDLGLPLGWVQTLLFASFIALVASTITGASLVLSDEPDDAAARRWLSFHVPLAWSLTAVSLLHGALSHLHGALAHYLL